MMYKLNSRWAISSDKYNWILTETTPTASKPYSRNTYYATLNQLSNVLVDRQVKDTVTRLSITESKKMSTTKRIGLLIDKTTQDLENFLQKVTHNEKNHKNAPQTLTGQRGKTISKHAIS